MKKAILVGDIGSTKSTWVYSTDIAQELHLGGYNPVTQSEKQETAFLSPCRLIRRIRNFQPSGIMAQGLLIPGLHKLFMTT